MIFFSGANPETYGAADGAELLSWKTWALQNLSGSGILPSGSGSALQNSNTLRISLLSWQGDTAMRFVVKMTTLVSVWNSFARSSADHLCQVSNGHRERSLEKRLEIPSFNEVERCWWRKTKQGFSDSIQFLIPEEQTCVWLFQSEFRR